MSSSGLCIGIDLGTSYSSVGVWQSGHVEVLADDQGNRRTPSFVALRDTCRLFGDAAKSQAARHPENTVYDVKRIIGRRFSDVQADMKLWPFGVVSDIRNKPQIVLQHKGETKMFYAEEISSMVLGRMREIAEANIGQRVENAVITVPAHFNNLQREATKDAGTIAGLNVLRVISEPMAAAIAYGTCEVSLVEIEEGVFEVKATAGEPHLGGEDFDTRLVDYCASVFKRNHGKELTNNHRAMRRLRTACERAKCALSAAAQAYIEIDSLCEGIDFMLTVTRAQFEDLCDDYFLKLLNPVKKVLVGLSASIVGEVVVVGGSSRIPKVQQLLSEFFSGKTPCKSLNCDEAVTIGAAAYAAIISHNAPSEALRNVLAMEVTPQSFRIDTGRGMTTLIPRNAMVPTKKIHTFSTNADNQLSVMVRVYEGEYSLVRDNDLLSVFRLDGILPMEQCERQIDVTFDVDKNGILSVAGVEIQGRNIKWTITNDGGRLSPTEIARMALDAENFTADDTVERLRVEAKNTLENYAYDLRNTLHAEKTTFQTQSTPHYDDLIATINLAMNWIDQTVSWVDSHSSAEKWEFESKQSELEGFMSFLY